MDDPTEKMSYGPGKKVLNPFALKRPKKRSLVERELETNMTSRMISPVTISDGVSTSRYGRARRMKSENDNKNTTIDTFKSPTSENTPTKSSPAIKEVKSDSKGKPYNKTETPKKALERSLDNIDNIYQENKTFSRFKTSNNSMSSAKKVYIQKDLIQNRDDDDDDGIVLIKDLFSPKHSPKVTPRTARKKKTENSSSKPQLTSKKPNGHEDILSVVKTLDFDTIKKDEVVCETMEKPQNNSNNKDSMKNIKIKHEIEVKPNSSEMIDIEAACPFQVGDLAWARMGTFPFWPCIITRDPASDVFVKQKLFGRVEHNILHVTFFADNGRRSWVVDNMLRQYKGLDEFMSTREKFTPEDKKKDPRLYAAFFISEKKHSLWKTSVEEAEMINREPKRTRIDAFNELLYKFRESKKKSSKVSRTDSDVSLSESLYDSLFSEDDSKDDSVRTRNRSKNKSLDVSDVVTACLDNMAAKTGNSKIQRQSHMDRWLQKAKSKTPEKVKTNLELTPIKVPILVPKTEPVDTFAIKVEDITQLLDKIVPKIEKPDKPVSNRSKKRKLPPKEVKITKVYGLRRSYESQNSFVEESEDVDMQNVSKSKSNGENDVTDISQSGKDNSPTTEKAKNPTSVTNDNCDDVLNAIDELLDDDSPKKKSTKIAKEIFKKESTETSTTMEITTINIEIKPEIMDVDEDQEQEVNYAEKSTTTENIEVFDSPVKIEKESDTQIFSSNDAINENTALDKTVSPSKSVLSLNGVSPLKINKTPKKTASTKDKTSKPTQTSPLKNNEMVLIPENIKLTDDDNSLTAFDDVNAKNVDENSTNSTVETVKSNEEECCLKDKPLTILNDAPKDTMAILTLDSISADKAHKDIVNAKETENYNNNMSNDEVVEDDINTSKEDKLNESGVSESILQIGNEIVDTNVKSEPDLKSSYKLIVPEVVVNDEALPSPKIEQESNEPKTIVNEDSTLKIDEETANEKNKSNPFLDDSRNTDCVDSASDKKQKKEDFREEDMNKPPDLTSSSNEIDDLSDEDSEDEPSPEFEPLEDEIKEDFRQHMICIENNITDKKDDAQWVKVCNDIAILEESKVKLNDVKSSIGPGKNQEIVALNKSNLSLSDEQILSEISHENDKLTPSPKSDLSNQSLTKEIKTELLDNNTEFVENSIKSPRDKRRYKLSLRRDKSKIEIENLTKSTEYIQDSNIINPLYKTIDQIEDIIKSKPKRLPLENGEVYISGIMENGLKREIVEDDDFDVDNASVSSEDSEVSLPQNNVPARRSLRSKDKRVGLQDPEFLTYLELRQDVLP